MSAVGPSLPIQRSDFTSALRGKADWVERKGAVILDAEVICLNDKCVPEFDICTACACDLASGFMRGPRPMLQVMHLAVRLDDKEIHEGGEQTRYCDGGDQRCNHDPPSMRQF